MSYLMSFILLMSGGAYMALGIIAACDGWRMREPLLAPLAVIMIAVGLGCFYAALLA